MPNYQGLIIKFILVGSLLTNSYASIPRINVKIASALKEVKVSGTDIQNRIEITKTSKVYPGRKLLKFNC